MSIAQEKKISSELAKRMDKITSKIDRTVNIISKTTKTSSVFWARIQKELKDEYLKARVAFTGWSEKAIVAWYNKQIMAIFGRMKNLKIKAAKAVDLKTFLKSNIHRQSKFALVSEAVSSYVIGLDSGEKELLRLAAITQQINIGQKEIDAQILAGELPDGSIYTPFRDQQTPMLEKALDGKYITVIDKNGAARNYNVESYTDMVVRTKLRQTSTVATINSAVAAGTDLVQVSSHNTKTEFDAQFEGKIYSLSGSDPDFPQATFLPPFHPNCWHNITPVFRETLERRGVKEYSDFAKGKTFTHPTRETHIPVNERGFNGNN